MNVTSGPARDQDATVAHVTVFGGLVVCMGGPNLRCASIVLGNREIGSEVKIL